MIPEAEHDKVLEVFCRVVMKKAKQTFEGFMTSPAGMIVAFIVLFYAITFLVYYFYSPGPEERRQAELEKTSAASRQIHDIMEGSIQTQSQQK